MQSGLTSYFPTFVAYLVSIYLKIIFCWEGEKVWEHSWNGESKFWYNIFCFYKYLSLNIQIRNFFGNKIIFITSNWCKLCYNYLDNMVTPCSTSQEEEVERTLVKFVICVILLLFEVVEIYVFSCQIFNPRFSGSRKRRKNIPTLA